MVAEPAPHSRKVRVRPILESLQLKGVGGKRTQLQPKAGNGAHQSGQAHPRQVAEQRKMDILTGPFCDVAPKIPRWQVRASGPQSSLTLSKDSS